LSRDEYPQVTNEEKCPPRYGEQLRVYENRMLKRIYGPKRDEVTGGWRKLRNEQLHKSYSSLTIIRIMKSKKYKLGRACRT
jgi:hypothetical protein